MKTNVLKRVLLDGLVILVICVVIFLFGWYWFKPNSTLCSTSSSSSYKNELDMDFRLRFVQEMMLESWNAYEQSAWGDEALKPVSRSAYDGAFGKGSGLSIVASMSTLWIMNLNEEFQKGKKWIETELDLRKLDRNVKVFDVVTHYVGGLLSYFALTNDSMFLNKAKEIAQLVEPAFNTETGIPYQNITLNSSKPNNKDPYLSYIGGFQVDFTYLSDATNETKYSNMINRIQENLKQIKKPKNLFSETINIRNYWSDGLSSLSILSREFYISLVKSFVQSNYLDVQSIEMYKEAMDAMEAVKMINVSPGGLYFAREYQYNSANKYSEYIQYGTCYLGAMLSLGANAMKQALTMNWSIEGKQKSKELYRIRRHWKLAGRLTETCHVASNETKTGLGPKSFYFNHTKETIILDHEYYLNPEFAESNFVLWRLTKNQKYRDYAWEMARAIKQYCKVANGGFSTIVNVDEIPTYKHDHQPVYFLSATLKYLYLTFTDDDVLPLDQWVFNAQGHPLPICGHNLAYPPHICTNYYHNIKES